MNDRKPTAQQRQIAIARAQGYCEYCRSQVTFSPDPFAAEHILPRVRGGSNHADNLAVSCQGCNQHKFTSTEAVDPISEEMVPLYHPRLQRWRDHFTWNADLTLMVGLTPTGRATIEKMYLNREGVVNLRHALKLLKRHPPPF